MTNTVPNVSRELLERCAQYTPTLEKQEDRARALSELRAMLSAPSPAGVDGLEVRAYEDSGGALYTAKLLEIMAVDSVGCEPLCRLSGAHAIIDGLRGENERIRLNIAEYNESIACYQSERDQHAQRIGELEGLLREARKDKTRLDQIVMHGISVSAQLKSGEFCGPRGREWRVFKYGKEFSVYGETLREALDRAITAMSAGKDGE